MKTNGRKSKRLARNKEDTVASTSKTRWVKKDQNTCLPPAVR